MRADVAQSVERILGKDEVASSNLAISLRMPAEMQAFSLLFGHKMQDLRFIPAFFHFLYPPEPKFGIISGKISVFFDNFLLYNIAVFRLGYTLG